MLKENFNLVLFQSIICRNKDFVQTITFHDLEEEETDFFKVTLMIIEKKKYLSYKFLPKY